MKEKIIQVRPLSVGSMELMSRFKCAFMDGKTDLGSIIEYIFAHTENIGRLEAMSASEFKDAVKKFKYELSPDEVRQISEMINNQTKEVSDAAFTVENDKKKRGGIVRTILHRLFGP